MPLAFPYRRPLPLAPARKVAVDTDSAFALATPVHGRPARRITSAPFTSKRPRRRINRDQNVPSGASGSPRRPFGLGRLRPGSCDSHLCARAGLAGRALPGHPRAVRASSAKSVHFLYVFDHAASHDRPLRVSNPQRDSRSCRNDGVNFVHKLRRGLNCVTMVSWRRLDAREDANALIQDVAVKRLANSDDEVLRQSPRRVALERVPLELPLRQNDVDAGVRRSTGRGRAL